MSEQLADRTARARIAEDLRSTLFVDAGAGSGKTRELVNRVVALVTSGEVELAEIAAITFTEKAATELRDRLRAAFDHGAAGEGDTAGRCRVALDQLDSAAIGTLHSFARRILTEHPVEAGLPPRVEVLDEVTSEVEFERRWTEFRDDLLAAPEHESTLLLLFAAGVKPAALRALASAFDQNWDLVAERVPAVVADPPGVTELLEPVLVIADEVCGLRDHCTDESDKLLAKLDELNDYCRRLRAVDDDVDLLELLGEARTFRLGNVGRGEWWSGVTPPDVRARAGAVLERLSSIRTEVASACAHRIGVELRRFTLAAADERRAAGQLEFHDLLVLARSVLTDPVHGPNVRTALHDRYCRLLLDEFQDTDPI